MVKEIRLWLNLDLFLLREDSIVQNKTYLSQSCISEIPTDEEMDGYHV